MKTRKQAAWPAMIGLLLPVAMNAQVTVESNFITGTEFVGCDAFSNQPLRFTTVANYPHEWRTNNTLRLRLNHNASYTIGSFSTQGASGYLGLSPDGSLWNPLYANGPFSRLHIHDGKTIVQAAGYRPWMDNGITFTTNGDQMYIGHKVEPGFGQTAAVIQKQRLRRPRSVAGIYTALDRGSTTDAHC